jgi:Ca2+-binding RTX toxin-like protein
VARPAWLKYLGLGTHPVLDRLLEALANGGVDEAHVGGRLLRFVTVAGPTPADSAIRAGDSRPSPAVIPAESAVIVPAATEADVPAAPAPTVISESAVTTIAADPQASADAGDERSAIAMIGGALNGGLGNGASPMSGTFDDASRYVVIYGENLDAGLVIDRSNNTLLSGGPGDHPELGVGDDDTLVLQGDFSSGFGLPSQPHGLDTVVVAGDNDFSLSSTDDQVDPGETLTINAMPLGAGHHLSFDGSAESDGRFIFFGSDAGDSFIGGAGNDRISGLGGADILAGGGGRDTFAYFDASESTGAAYDTLGDFDAASDKIDLVGTVTGFHAPVEGGTLSLATFNSDLAAALSGLGASQAAWFAPDAGDLAGQIFLIVDANGVAGYQEGEDYVFAVSGTPLVDLSGHTDIFV